jgi:hypothetical protein
VTVSVIAHALLVLALFSARAIPQKAFEQRAIDIGLVDGSPVAPIFLPQSAAASSPSPPLRQTEPVDEPTTKPTAKPVKTDEPKPVDKPVVQKAIAPPTKRSPSIDSILAAAASSESGDSGAVSAQAELSEAQIAGAARAGAGPRGGRECDMASRLQEALGKDPLVRNAIAPFAGKSVMVWNGDWVWMNGDVGKGFTAVRQAMMWEIAFAPKACRAEPMHGLVLFSLYEAHGQVRLAVGSGTWRWTDLLVPHPGAAG